MSKSLLSSLAAVFAAAPLFAGTPMPVLNPGFEEGKKAWTDDKGEPSQVTKEAAHSGNLGLRIVDPNLTDYNRVISEPIKITAGKSYRLEMMIRQVQSHGINGILWFLDENKKIIPWPDGSRLLIRPADEATGWEKLGVEGKAPDNAVYAEIHIQSNRMAAATVDFDDITLTQLD
jgi:hypothetical protein